MRVACVMMQKNEEMLLDPWISYHSYLFGVDNLYVLDNGSTSDAISVVLKKFETIGLNVIRNYDSPEDFSNKGQIIGSLIQAFKKDGSYDAVFALDCDEFVAVSSESGVSCLRRDVQAYLCTLRYVTAMIRVGHCLDNRPGFVDLFRFASFQKSLIPVKNFDRVDHGFHEPKSVNDEPMVASKLVFIHMHFKPFETVKAHAREKLAPFVNVDDASALAAFSGVGRHLVSYFQVSEEAYYSEIGKYPYPLVGYSGFIAILSALSPLSDFVRAWCKRPDWLTRETVGRDIVELSNGFSASSYLAANPDVAANGMDAALHYCLFGFRERRPTTKAG